jgi:hypothetical protein
MTFGVVLVVVLFLALAVLGGIYALRQREPVPPVPLGMGRSDDAAERRARHQTVDTLGSELLQRRADLEARRGTLMGDSQVYDEFVALEDRLRSGEITEDEFEREKLRLLGG